MFNKYNKIKCLNHFIKKFFPKFPNYNPNQEIKHVMSLYEINCKSSAIFKIEDKNKLLKELKNNIKNNDLKNAIKLIDILIEEYEINYDFKNPEYIELIDLKEDFILKTRNYLWLESNKLNLIELSKISGHEKKYTNELYFDFLKSKNFKHPFNSNELYKKIDIQNFDKNLLFRYFYDYSINEFICGIKSIELNKEYVNKKEKTYHEYFNESFKILNSCFEINFEMNNFDDINIIGLYNNKAIFNYYYKQSLKENLNLTINKEIKYIINKNNKYFYDETLMDSNTLKEKNDIIPFLFLCFKDLNYFDPLNFDNLLDYLNDKKALLELSENEDLIKILLNITEIFFQSNLKLLKKLGKDYLNIAYKTLMWRSDKKYELRCKFLYAVYLFESGKIYNAEKLLREVINSNKISNEEDYLKLLSYKMLEKIDLENSENIKEKIKYLKKKNFIENHHYLFIKLIN